MSADVSGMRLGIVMSPFVVAVALAACGGGEKMGAVGTTGGMGSMGAGPKDAGPAPDDPLARPTDEPLVLRFSYSLSEELACSQSFESDGWSAKYELVLEPSGAATLSVYAGRSHAFGPSMARFQPDMEDEVRREQSGSDRTWRGTVEWIGERFVIAFEPAEAQCKTLVDGKGWYAVECEPSSPLALACARAAVDALPPALLEASAKDPDATEAVQVFECTPPLGLPAAGELDVPLPDALPFAAAPGLELEYWRHGIGNFDEPKLRLAAPDTPVDVD